MSDNNFIIGEIKGTLNEFKVHTDKRFDRIEVSISEVHKSTLEAHKKAEAAHDYAKGVVRNATAWGTGAACGVTALFGFLQHIPQAIAKIVGLH